MCFCTIQATKHLFEHVLNTCFANNALNAYTSYNKEFIIAKYQKFVSAQTTNFNRFEQKALLNNSPMQTSCPNERLNKLTTINYNDLNSE